jgi:hypothetical protein
LAAVAMSASAAALAPALTEALTASVLAPPREQVELEPEVVPAQV